RQALEAARAVSAALGKALSIEIGWEKGAAPEIGRAWAELLRRVTAVLHQTLADALGKQALASLARVVLRDGPALQATRKEDSLVLVAPLTSAISGVPRESEIKQALDDAL